MYTILYYTVLCYSRGRYMLYYIILLCYIIIVYCITLDDAISHSLQCRYLDLGGLEPLRQGAEEREPAGIRFEVIF